MLQIVLVTLLNAWMSHQALTFYEFQLSCIRVQTDLGEGIEVSNSAESPRIMQPPLHSLQVLVYIHSIYCAHC